MSDKRYKIVGEPGDYQIMEQFGNYRMMKKKFKTIEKATERIKQMNGEVSK